MKKRILILSFYYAPDLCAGSFRATALIESLQPIAETLNIQVDIITTQPNRYANFQIDAPTIETQKCVTIHRIKIPTHQSGFVDQAKAFRHYFFKALYITKNNNYDLIYATSSRLFTAFLGARIAVKKRKPLFLDMRDIFTDTMDSLLGFPMKALFPLFYCIERYTIKKATAINLVSPGFLSYYKINKNCQVSTVSNGVDQCFYNIDYTNIKKSEVKRVVYAGNFGKGQALEKILPALAKASLNECEFFIIGSGRQSQLLKSVCDHLKNVHIIPPVERQKLIQHYRDADILFLHFDNLPAFQKVLPSKIFEYAITGKPVLAGVSGYAADFLKSQVSGSWVFPPCHIEQGVAQLKAILNSDFKKENRIEFYEKFNREK